MAKKTKVTQEMANGFPKWTKVRMDDQSIGQQLLNTIGVNLERIETELFRGFKNTSLTTANVGEIDLTYRYTLPRSFFFEVDDVNTLSPIPVPPTMSGLIEGEWVEIAEAESGGLREFWYDAIPDRVTEVEVYSGEGYKTLDAVSSGLLWESIPNPPSANNLLVTVQSGIKLFDAVTDNSGEFTRAKVRIEGTTWKGTSEVEEIGFLYNQTLKSIKVWEKIDKIEALDFPSEANISVRSHGFFQKNAEDSFELTSQFKDGRDNMPHFWNLEESCWLPGLTLLTDNIYVVNKAIDVLRNRTEVQPYRQWELLNESEDTIEPLDIALLPYQERFWAVSASGLYLYDNEWNQPDIKLLTGKTNSPLAQITLEKDYVTRDEPLEVELRFVRPIKTVVRHRFSITFPDGVTMGVLADGTLVAGTEDFWVASNGEERLLRHSTELQLEEYGDHVLTLEVSYFDGSVETDKRLVRVDFKKPLREFDLYTLIGEEAKAIDIDHQQRILVLDVNDNIHRLDVHYDIALIDYLNKELVFREPYEEVKVIK